MGGHHVRLGGGSERGRSDKRTDRGRRGRWWHSGRNERRPTHQEHHSAVGHDPLTQGPDLGHFVLGHERRARLQQHRS